MKLFSKVTFILAMYILGTTACSDSFLETAPLDEGSVEGFFETQEDVVRALNSVYDVFQGSIWGGSFFYNNYSLDGMTDNAVGCCPWEFAIPTIAKGEHSPTSGGLINSKWDFGYEGIFRANSVLGNIEDIEMDAGVKNSIIAEARFLRGMILFELTNFYGDVPLILNVITREEGLSVTRTSKAEVVAAATADLDFAEANLGDDPLFGHIGRATKKSAIAVKTRMKLYNADFAGAAAEAKKLIDMSRANPDAIGLVDNYESVFSADNENNKEVLFDIQFTEGTQGEGNFMQVGLAPGPEGAPGNGWGSYTPTDQLANSFYMTDGLPIDESPLYNPDEPYANRDARMAANLFIPGVSEWRGNVYDASLSGFSPFFAIRKWVDLDATLGEDGCSCNETNFILYRYGDILMSYAEALNETSGPSAEVYDAINQIRTRAGMPEVAAGLSQAEMRDVIRHERQVEFAWEGTRRDDLIRWNVAADIIPTVTLFGESLDSRVFVAPKHNLWPVPQKEIDQNPNLTQNPGW